MVLKRNVMSQCRGLMMAPNSHIGGDRLQDAPLKTMASPVEWADAARKVVPVQGSNARCQGCLGLHQAMLHAFSKRLLASIPCAQWGSRLLECIASLSSVACESRSSRSAVHRWAISIIRDIWQEVSPAWTGLFVLHVLSGQNPGIF